MSSYAATPTPNRDPSTWLGSLRSGERGGGGSGSGGSSKAVIIVAEVLEVAVIRGGSYQW